MCASSRIGGSAVFFGSAQQLCLSHWHPYVAVPSFWPHLPARGCVVPLPTYSFKFASIYIFILTSTNTYFVCCVKVPFIGPSIQEEGLSSTTHENIKRSCTRKHGTACPSTRKPTRSQRNPALHHRQQKASSLNKHACSSILKERLRRHLLS